MYYLRIYIVVCVFCVFILQTGCEFMGSMRFSYEPMQGCQTQHVEIWHKGLHSRIRYVVSDVPVEGKRCRTQWDTVCKRGRQPRLGNTPGGLSVNAAWGKQIYMHVTDGSTIHYNGKSVQVSRRRVTHKGCVSHIDHPQYCSCLLYDDVKWRCYNDKHVYNQCLYTLQDTNNAERAETTDVEE